MTLKFECYTYNDKISIKTQDFHVENGTITVEYFNYINDITEYGYNVWIDSYPIHFLLTSSLEEAELSALKQIKCISENKEIKINIIKFHVKHQESKIC